uniref:Wings apart-like protein C-terminal domain-containing protein n=1 Tax=Hanusia phi TaxID=3032 RepID=A0A7S0HYW2_9CRYP|mmetsp:Transcript_6610/g.15123  ORF Transcript_6610/g.15123 Transcript_6610/m.15123 type:complete len:611 (+) Transcript_6610:78-1910(+)
MPPRRYGKSLKPVVVATLPVPIVSETSQDALDCEGAVDVGGASAIFGEPLEPDSSCNSLDDFDFSDNVSAWKVQTESKPIKTKANSNDMGEVGAQQGKRLGQSGDSDRKTKQSKASKEPIAIQQVSTSFIGEFGQARAKLDDIDFVIDGLVSSQSADVRMASTVSLVKLCRDGEMRALLRAHSLVDKVLECLQGIADKEDSLTLPVAAALFYLSLDSANTQMVKGSTCRLLFQVMTSPASATAPLTQLEQEAKPLRRFQKRKSDESTANKLQDLAGKVIEICVQDCDVLEIPSEVEDRASLVTAEHLMVLACSHLLSRDSAFRESFRVVGGLEKSSLLLLEALGDASRKTSAWLADARLVYRLGRDLSLMEAVTFLNETNQRSVLQGSEEVVPGLIQLVSIITEKIKERQERDEMSSKIERCRLSALKILVNLTNHNETGWRQLGAAGGVDQIFQVLEACSSTSSADSYDALTLSLGLIINCIELSAENREQLLAVRASSGKRSLQLLTELFRSKVVAVNGEIKFDKMKIEDLVLAAYTSVLLGCSIQDSPAGLQMVKEALGEWTLLSLIQVLDYFIVCHQEADKGQTATEEFISSLQSVVKVLAKLARA